MPAVRKAIEAFVSGTLDYGGLQYELENAARAGTTRDLAFDELRLVDSETGLSPALNDLIARAIDRHFAAGVRWRMLPNTAGDGEDYVGNDWQRLELADGSAAARIFVPLVNDGIPERTESFYVELARPDGDAALGDRIRAEVQVTDDDPR